MNAATKEELQQQFWKDVEQLLTGNKYRHPLRCVQEGIDAYKQSIRQHACGNIPDAVYNQGEEKTAEVVNGVIQSGLPSLHSQPA
jgi:hypothetical protein